MGGGYGIPGEDETTTEQQLTQINTFQQNKNISTNLSLLTEIN